MHPINAAGLSHVSQVSMHFAVAIDRAALKPGLLDLAGQLLVLFGSGRLRTMAPGVVTAGMNIQRQTHPLHRILFLMVLDKRVPHPDCFAKYAAAFFNMSRSSVTRLSSDSSRRILAAWSSCSLRCSGGTA